MILLHKPKGIQISNETRDKILTFLSFEKGGSFSYAVNKKKNHWTYTDRWGVKEESLDEILNGEAEAVLLLNSYTDQTRDYEKVPIFREGGNDKWFLLFQAGTFSEISSGFSHNMQNVNSYARIHKLYDNFLKFLSPLEARKTIEKFADKGEKFAANGYFITIDAEGCHRHGNFWKEIDGVFYSSDFWKDTVGLGKEEREKKNSFTPAHSYMGKSPTKYITQYNAKKTVEEDESINIPNVFLGLSFAEISADMKANYMPQSRLSNCYLTHARLYSPLLGEIEAGKLAFNSITYWVNDKFERYTNDPKLFELNSVKDAVHSALKKDYKVKVNLTFRDLEKQGISLQEFEILLLTNERPIVPRTSSKRDILIDKLKKRIQDSTPDFDVESYDFNDSTEEDLAVFAASFGIN